MQWAASHWHTYTVKWGALATTLLEGENHCIKQESGTLVVHIWQRVRLTLLSLMFPTLSMINYKFLYDRNNERMTKISASDAGSSVFGLAGNLQCPNFNAVRQLRCNFPKHCCDSQVGEANLDCFCQEQTLENYFRNRSVILPMKIGNHVIQNQSRKLFMQLNTATSSTAADNSRESKSNCTSK